MYVCIYCNPNIEGKSPENEVGYIDTQAVDIIA